MQKRTLGFLLAILGFGGMALAGYLFVTGSGGRGHLFEVTSYMILGAACFFIGINYIYESREVFTKETVPDTPELDEVSPIQQQWRTIQVTKAVAPSSNRASTRSAV
jgi:hypothetical protein